MIRLTDEEKEAIVTRHRVECEPCDYSFVKEGAKAQLKKVVEWGNERCPHHSNGYGPRRSCRKCWQALLEETK